MIHAPGCLYDGTLHNGPCQRAGEVPGSVETVDMVNHPPHYKAGGIEVIDVIEAYDLPAHLANVAKYVLRAGRKTGADTLEDLRKARWYLDRYISWKEARHGA